MSEDADKLEFAQEILMIRRKTCDNCWHGRKGHCALYSSDCATAVLNREVNPPYWMLYKEEDTSG